jgi:chromosome transmission fidelity protein 4
VLIYGSEIAVKVVNTKDMTKVQYLRDHPRSVKHVAFDNSGSRLAVSCTDGNVYMYSLSSEAPNMIKKVDGLIKSLESDAEASSKVLWHPDGRAFAAPTAGRAIQVMSMDDWEPQRAFKTGHSADITAAAWSPNGALLATTSSDLTLCLWETKTQRLLQKYDDLKATVLAMQWHPTENVLSYTNNDGELFIHTGFVPAEHAPLLERSIESAPFFHEPSESNEAKTGAKIDLPERQLQRRRVGTPDSLDDILGPDAISDDGMEDDFVVDDDGAGYAAPAINGHLKRTNGHLGALDYPPGKRRANAYSTFQPEAHEAFQPGSTPWRGNRRYLCLNLTGFVWTVSQEANSHNTVTVEFYDREFHRDFHFTDPFQYDKACLNEHGTLFSCQPSKDQPAMVYYRPHETWTSRTDWRTNLPAGESITAIALSDSYIVATTSANYIRIYTLYGIPFRVYRQKASPAVTCAAWRDYVLTIGNGPVSSDGSCTLLYTIENIRRDEIYQSSDIVALTPNSSLSSVFFSDEGDPYIYDSTGVLLTLLGWRKEGQARWVPMLGTNLLPRNKSGKREERYWPVAVANRRFHCIILKGQDRYPYFPRPILSEFDFAIPISSPPADKDDMDAMEQDEDDMDEDGNGKKKTQDQQSELEQKYLLSTVLRTQLASTLSSTRPTPSQRNALNELDVTIDRTLLQMLGLECLAGEERGMKALEIVTLMRDANGKMLDLAAKVATRYNREVLREKINELADRRAVALDEEDE